MKKARSDIEVQEIARFSEHARKDAMSRLQVRFEIAQFFFFFTKMANTETARLHGALSSRVTRTRS